jgi:hypothetical protein
VPVAAVTPENRTFDSAALARLLDGRYADVRRELREVMRRPEAFGIPDEVIAAPIGLADESAAQR